MEDRYFTTNDGVKLHYLEAGEGEPLVIVHGYRSEAAEFSNNLDVLAEHFHVYFLELRGHGASERTKKGPRTSRMGMDVGEFINSLPYEKVNLMGHSMGVDVCTHYVDLWTDKKLKKLILIDEASWSNGAGDDEEAALRSITNTYTAYRKMMNSFAEADEFMNKVTPEPANDISKTSPWYQKQKALPRHEQDNEFMAHLYLTFGFNYQADVIESINVPILFIYGETSRYLLSWYGKWIREHAKDCEVVGFTAEEFGRHSMFTSNPEKFNKLVIDFLNK